MPKNKFFLFNTLGRLLPFKNKQSSLIELPVRLSSNAPFVVVEKKYDLEHVFEKQTSLISYECLNVKLDLTFTPMSVSGDQTRWASLQLKSSNENLVSYEFPQLGIRASYAQLSELPQFLSAASSLHDGFGVEKSRFHANANRGMSTAGVWLVAAFVFVSTAVFFSSAMPVAPVLAAAVAPVAPIPPSALDASVALTSAGDQLNDIEKQILAKAVAQSGIELSSGGKPFVIFSDPNCPACRQLEAQIGDLDKSLSAVIVPVSFKPNSQNDVAAVLCASDVATAWRAAARGQPIAALGCAKGLAQAEANNAAFAALKFDRTPTIVTSSGKVAVGVKDFDGLLKWIKDNS